jgi:hypothetical protein
LASIRPAFGQHSVSIRSAFGQHSVSIWPTFSQHSVSHVHLEWPDDWLAPCGGGKRGTKHLVHAGARLWHSFLCLAESVGWRL